MSVLAQSVNPRVDFEELLFFIDIEISPRQGMTSFRL